MQYAGMIKENVSSNFYGIKLSVPEFSVPKQSMGAIGTE
jgi:hypothetical protein